MRKTGKSRLVLSKETIATLETLRLTRAGYVDNGSGYHTCSCNLDCTVTCETCSVFPC